MDTSTISNSEWDVNNKDPDYASASKSEAFVRLRKDYWQNKVLIAIICLCFLKYARNKNVNLLQVVNGYFDFAKNISKRCIKVLYQIKVMVSRKTIY